MSKFYAQTKTRNRLSLQFLSSNLRSLNKIVRFRIDDLDVAKIVKFKVNVVSKTIKFNFVFPEITISANKYETNTTLDALRELGIYVQYEGEGNFRFTLHNLRIAGKMKGKIPLIFGSAKLIYLKTQVTLEKFTSEITGLPGNHAANEFINRQIERVVEHTINSHTQQISDYIEELAKSEINPRLKGRDFWSLLNFILTGNDDEDEPIVSNCVPPPDTWE